MVNGGLVLSGNDIGSSLGMDGSRRWEEDIAVGTVAHEDEDCSYADGRIDG